MSGGLLRTPFRRSSSGAGLSGKSNYRPPIHRQRYAQSWAQPIWNSVAVLTALKYPLTTLIGAPSIGIPCFLSLRWGCAV